MAGPPLSTHRTHRRFLEQFDAALLDYAPKYMKEQLEQLARECDQRLERQLLPRLHALLREIDQERDAFEQHKWDAARRLREHLTLLPLDAAVVEDAVAQLHTVNPRRLARLPTASSLALPTFDSASVSPPSTSASSENAFGTPDEDSCSQAPISPGSTPETLSEAAHELITEAQPWTPPTKSPTRENEVQAQVLAESSTVPCGLKRPKVDREDEGDVLSKRQRTTNEKTPGVVQPQVERRVAFPNLKINECIFRHAERKGFFVVRCNFCKPGYFTMPPLLYNRALKHFQKHDEAIPGGSREMTNEYIFEKFAIQVDGDEMASKYWIQEHLGDMPHTFVPVGSSGGTFHAEDMEETLCEDQEIEYAFSTPTPKFQESLRGRQSDREAEHEKPRRARRNVPRPDYAEMVANKDPWNASETETEKTSKPVNTTRSTSRKRRLTKPGFSSTSKTADTKKPFGYMSEPWPRRSAPR
ncbi:hypothetical protein EV127DRAFT_175526 [Xylaria flabelliformis]|nr:hypothetical protein EV127DRAFT_175526 [Xylaria flabelliformis]